MNLFCSDGKIVEGQFGAGRATATSPVQFRHWGLLEVALMEILVPALVCECGHEESFGRGIYGDRAHAFPSMSEMICSAAHVFGAARHASTRIN